MLNQTATLPEPQTLLLRLCLIILPSPFKPLLCSIHRAQLEEDLARLLAQRAAGGFKPPADPEQAKLEAEVARMKQELLDLQKQKAGGGGQGNPQAQLSRLKEERYGGHWCLLIEVL
jgi:ribosomal protein L29